MLSIINEELFSYTHKVITNEKTGAKFNQLKIVSSNQLVGYQRGNGKNKYKNNDASTFNGNVSMRENPAIEHIHREIACINYPTDEQLENRGLFQNQATSVKVSDNRQHITSVFVRCLKDGAENRSNLYIIAIPFNGMLTPIPESKLYRIYKGMIIPSVRPFYVNNRRYRKMLYFVIEPHSALFDESHKYHTNVIDFTVESYAVFTDRDSGNEKTNHETFMLHITKDTSEVEWKYELLDEAKRIEPTKFGDAPLWTTFKFENPNSSEEPSTSYKPKSNKKTGYIEGNNYITTNKNGIRKEVPRNGKKYGYHSNYNKDNQNYYNNYKSNKNGKGRKSRYNNDKWN